MARYLKKSQPEMSGSLGLRGGLSMMSKSGGLKPRAVAGRPSVTRLTHSSWTGIKASGRPRMAVRKMLQTDTGETHKRQPHTKTVPARQLRLTALLSHHTTSPTFEEMRYLMNCFMLL